MREGLRAAATESAPLLDRLTNEQLAHLERRLAEENRKFAKDNLAGMDDLLRRSLGPSIAIEFELPADLPPAVADQNQVEPQPRAISHTQRIRVGKSCS